MEVQYSEQLPFTTCTEAKPLKKISNQPFQSLLKKYYLIENLHFMPQRGNTIFLYLELWKDKPVKYNSLFFPYCFS